MTRLTYRLLLLPVSLLDVFGCDLTRRQVSQRESRRYKILMRAFIEPLEKSQVRLF